MQEGGLAGAAGPILEIVKAFLGSFFGASPDYGAAITATYWGAWFNRDLLGNALLDSIKAVISTIGKIISAIAKALVHIISDILHGHLLAALHELQKLFHTLHDLLNPLLKFIERLRGYYFKYIYPWMHLVQQILSTVRTFLEVFRLLGAKWAAKLDADIQKIQSIITEINQGVISTLNSISTTLGLVLDPFGVLRQDFFGRTMWNSLGDLKKTLGYGSTRPIFPDEKKQEAEFKGAVYGPSPLVTTGADGSLVYDPALKTVDDSMNRQMQTLGIAP